MGNRKPGPVCSTRVGDDWIDKGTACRTRVGAPGPAGVAEDLIFAELAALSPFRKKFDTDHVYSMAPEAARKRTIDLQIISDDYSRSAEISIDNEAYLKQLIKIASNGNKEVSVRAKKIQFFIIRGGAEGLFPVAGLSARGGMARRNANNVTIPGQTTSGAASDFHFDLNDLLAVFQPNGKLIGAALLQRPTFVPGRWSTKSANEVYNAWDNKEVAIYRNKHPEMGWVEYLGLTVDEGKKSVGWVDMHKQEATNGCIFIDQEGTPALGDPSLDNFEPKLIIDILASIGKVPSDIKPSRRVSLGMMHLIEVK
jgi:hypothetical protein